MINIPETYQIIILVIVLLLLGYYALVLNKKEYFGFVGFSINDFFNPVKDFIKNHITKPVTDVVDSVKKLPEKAKNKVFELIKKPIKFVKKTIKKVKNVVIKVYNFVRGILKTIIGFAGKKLIPFLFDKIDIINDKVMSKITPILGKTVDFVINRLKTVWGKVIEMTGIPDMLQTGYYISLGLIIFGIFINSFSIFEIMIPVKCLECNCTCD